MELEPVTAKRTSTRKNCTVIVATGVRETPKRLAQQRQKPGSAAMLVHVCVCVCVCVFAIFGQTKLMRTHTQTHT